MLVWRLGCHHSWVVGYHHKTRYFTSVLIIISLGNIAPISFVLGCYCLFCFDVLTSVVDWTNNVLISALLLVRCFLIAFLLYSRQMMVANTRWLTLQVLYKLWLWLQIRFFAWILSVWAVLVKWIKLRALPSVRKEAFFSNQWKLPVFNLWLLKLFLNFSFKFNKFFLNLRVDVPKLLKWSTCQCNDVATVIRLYFLVVVIICILSLHHRTYFDLGLT